MHNDEPRKPLEERGQFPHEEEEEGGKRAKSPAPDPDRPATEKADPTVQRPIEESETAPEEQGQEGVGPGPRDLARTEEKPALEAGKKKRKKRAG